MGDQRPMPIAVIGVGCRFPGGGHGTEKLWQILSEGNSAWSDVPSDSAFDAAFFGIRPLEAQAIDPQQRILLETAYEALENGGIPLESARGSNTAVYVAVYSRDYDRMMYKDIDQLSKYHTTAAGDAILANRISYTFDLKGPSMTLDTGCSGSMVALHQACQSLRTGECDMALVGGANLILSPDTAVALSSLRLLNDDGKCYSFDSRGSGYGRGEGVAVVALKRLDDALQAGDPIRAIIRNTAINQDGKTAGILRPSRDAQEELLRSIYQRAGLNPRDTVYVEAHGTGTVAGDIAEMEAIANVFCSHDARESCLYVGSIKSNIGHLESASGLAGLIKAVLVLEKGLIPANLNIETTKEGLRLETRGITIPSQLTPWPTPAVRRVSVNSFGYGGTNAHAILESAPTRSCRDKLVPTAVNRHVEKVKRNRKFYRECCQPNQSRLYDDFKDSEEFTRHAVDVKVCHCGNCGLHSPQFQPLRMGGLAEAANGGATTDSNVEDANGDTNLAATYNDWSDGISNGEVTRNMHVGENGTGKLSTNGTTTEQLVCQGPLNQNPELREEESYEAQLFVASARTEKSLLEVLDGLRHWINHHCHSNTDLRNLAYTLSVRRSMMQWRSSFIAATRQDVLSSLDGGLLRATEASTDPQIVLLFSGPGAQWSAMGRELLSSHSKFRQSLNRSDSMLRDLGAPWSLLEELSRDEATTRIKQSEIGQAASIAIQIALVDLLVSFGIKPDAVLGHLSGEIAAAYAAGALSHLMALKVAYLHSFLHISSRRDLNGKHAMLAVSLGEEEASVYVEKLKEGVACVVYVDSPQHTTISGDEAAIAELQSILDSLGIINRKLEVDRAYHSYHMRMVADQYLQALDGLEAGVPRASIAFMSSVTAAKKESNFGPSYWIDNLVSKVRFCDAVKELCRMRHEELSSRAVVTTTIFIEVGPHSTVLAPLTQTITHLNFKSFKYVYQPCMVRGRSALQTILEVTGRLFEQGVPVDLRKVHLLGDSKDQPTVIHNLSPYPWDHSTKFWHESRLSREYRFRHHPYHDLLGVRISTSTDLEPGWRNIISLKALPWLRKHIIDSVVTFPAASYVCMVIEALRQVSQCRESLGVVGKYRLKDVSFCQKLNIPDPPDSVEVQLSLRSQMSATNQTSTEWKEFRIWSVSQEGKCSEHCRGLAKAELAGVLDKIQGHRENDVEVVAPEAEWCNMKDISTEHLSSQSIYHQLRSNGNNYGAHFATVVHLEVGNRRQSGTLAIADISDCMPSKFVRPHVIHPTTLDAIMHSAYPLSIRHCSLGSLMPISIGELTVSSSFNSSPGAEVTVSTSIPPARHHSALIETMAFQMNESTKQNPVVTITDWEFRRTGENPEA